METRNIKSLNPEDNEKFAIVLTLSGAFPFLFFTMMNLIHPNNPLWYKILIDYTAVILSFLGGIHWGLAISIKTKFSSLFRYLIVLSIIPVLIGWILLLIPIRSLQLDIFILAYIWVLIVDFFLEKNNIISKIFFKTRIVISALVVCILIVARIFITAV